MKKIIKNNPKVALITGASRRIGSVITRNLSTYGYKVIIHYNKSKKEALQLSLDLNKEKVNSKAIQADLSIESEVKELFYQAQSTFGTIHCIINNASEFKYDNISTITSKSWKEHIEPNLRAPIILAKELRRNLQSKEVGNIINIIDQRVLNLTPHFLSYTLSKSALWTLTKTLALSMAPYIRVNAIGPGPTLKSNFQTKKEFDLQCKSMPLRKGTNPQEIAKTILFILSISSMTGQMIALDGGQHLGWGQVNKDTNIND